jgi:hypothetical protein
MPDIVREPHLKLLIRERFTSDRVQPSLALREHIVVAGRRVRLHATAAGTSLPHPLLNALAQVADARLAPLLGLL